MIPLKTVQLCEYFPLFLWRPQTEFFSHEDSSFFLDCFHVLLSSGLVCLTSACRSQGRTCWFLGSAEGWAGVRCRHQVPESLNGRNWEGCKQPVRGTARSCTVWPHSGSSHVPWGVFITKGRMLSCISTGPLPICQGKGLETGDPRGVVSKRPEGKSTVRVMARRWERLFSSSDFYIPSLWI